jgi:hypothetical protein
VRVTNLTTGKLISFPGEIQRPANWHAISGRPTLPVPRTKIRIEALHGLETEIAVREVDLRGTAASTVTIPLKRFYDAGARGLRSGNTHLHLQKLTYEEAMRYLRVVSGADDLDLVFVSHLRRTPTTAHTSRTPSPPPTWPGSPAEARSSATARSTGHNFGRNGEGYGHVLFLDILKLIQPVSVGPGTHAVGHRRHPPPARHPRGAEGRGHRHLVPQHSAASRTFRTGLAGLVDAQNIFERRLPEQYEDTFYRYLDIGMRVPFSTGTDWFIYDFSRVYVPVSGRLTSKKWLAAWPGASRTSPTACFLELEADGKGLGDTIAVQRVAQELRIRRPRAGPRGLRPARAGAQRQGDPQRRRRRRRRPPRSRARVEAGPGGARLDRAAHPHREGQNEMGHPLFGHTGPILPGDERPPPLPARGRARPRRRDAPGIEEVGAKGVFRERAGARRGALRLPALDRGPRAAHRPGTLTERSRARQRAPPPG